MKVENMTDKQKIKLIRFYYKLKDIEEGRRTWSGFIAAERMRIKNNMLQKPLQKMWFCKICGNNKKYKSAGMDSHLQTKKHFENYLRHYPWYDYKYECGCMIYYGEPWTNSTE